LVLSFVVICFLVFPKRAARPALPVPNGYEDFLKAAQNAVSHEHRAYGEGNDTEIRNLVTENHVALDLARLGCQRDCRVTTDYRRDYAAYATQHLPVLAQFKKVALAFRAEGELAEREGRTNDAARFYLDGIRFGQESCRGGLLIDRLVGVACEAISYEGLSRMAPDLGARTCRDTAQVIESLEAKREPWASTLLEERSYFRAVSKVPERLAGLAQQLFRWCKSLQTPAKDPRQHLERVQRSERRLILQLAARAHELEHGKAPVRATDLVPEYLKAVPKDPATGQEMALP
jgi:hypothetical protein